VPSIWWENSPVVIQEAFSYGRPVICSDIGGMAEKVNHRVDGLHFKVGSPEDLARTIESVVAGEVSAEALAGNTRVPISVPDSADAHLALYALLKQAKLEQAEQRRAASGERDRDTWGVGPEISQAAPR
jgi:glycosyltransferase involved in cell wall biosynthesis